MNKNYLSLIRYCESYLEKYGDSFLGVGWTKKQEYADARYRVMLEVIKGGKPEKVTLLDFGCGASHLYEYIVRNGLDYIEYAGLDLSEKFLSLSKSKFPFIKYYDLDILEADAAGLPTFDYIVLNGVFNSKCSLEFDEMLTYLMSVIERVFSKARVAIAFNVMSKQVDWERDDLFHLPFDVLADFLSQRISRNFIIRHDYGLYEYTTYVYR